MLEKYKTILNEAQAEIIEKKSRFIATVKPVSSEDKAREFIEYIKKKYWNATHNTFAYQIGENNEIRRSSDDGEPAGTAGKPILNILIEEDIKNAAIVVTRYFGGTLLGTGGLIRAYGKAAKEGILSAGVFEMTLYNKFSLKGDYSLSGKIQYEILQQQHIIYETLYSDIVEYIVFVESSKSQKFIKNITNISNGNIHINDLGLKYGVFINGELKINE